MQIEKYEPGTPSWVGLSSPDVDASRRFYGDLFGWSADSDPRPDSGGYRMFKQDGLNVARVGPSQPGSPPPWTCYVTMPDADQTAAAVERAGGSVLLPPMDVLDVGRMGIFAGPTGAVIAGAQGCGSGQTGLPGGVAGPRRGEAPRDRREGAKRVLLERASDARYPGGDPLLPRGLRVEGECGGGGGRDGVLVLGPRRSHHRRDDAHAGGGSRRDPRPLGHLLSAAGDPCGDVRGATGPVITFSYTADRSAGSE